MLILLNQTERLTGNKGKRDHKHRYLGDEGIFYQFLDAHQLLKDFWMEVDKILDSLGLKQDK